ncbi:hypothetical protein LCGC14_2356980, partial [marine sediment metagenome]
MIHMALNENIYLLSYNVACGFVQPSVCVSIPFAVYY